MQRRQKRLLEALAIGVAAAMAALLIWRTGILDRWEYTIWAWRVEFFARPAPATDRIKLILLDQASLDWGKKQNGLSWPWPREVYAPIIDFCTRHGARAVIFDVLYTEPSVYGVADDESLGRAIGRAPSFIGALSLHRDAANTTSWPAGTSGRLSLNIEDLRDRASSLPDSVHGMKSATFPIEEVMENATILGNVMEEPDPDGIFRRAHLFQVFDGRIVPSLGFAAFEAGGTGPLPRKSLKEGADRERINVSDKSIPIDGEMSRERIEVRGKSIPIDSEGKMIIRFRGKTGRFQTFSAASIIQSELAAAGGGGEVVRGAESLRDAYVFFGFSAPGLMDLRPTPISSVCPGVEIHATVLDNLLSGDFLKDSPAWAVGLAAMLLSLIASVSIVTFGRRGSWHSIPVVAAVVPLPMICGFAAYPLGWWLPVVVLEGGVLLSLGGALVLNYASEGRQKAFIKKAFYQYLSPAVIERLLLDPSRLKLGGERREITIMFSDLEGFSSFSEKLDPETLTRLLNDYLSDMTDIILDEGGTLDKYEGDAIIAFWNAPVNQDDHAERACRAALRCQEKLQARREEFRQRTGTVLRARIGINTGEVVVGNMGSKRRFDYTILGDAANLASRLEGANKAFGTFTMISEATWGRTSGKFAGREIGLIRVVGRGKPVRVFEPRAMAGSSDLENIRKFDRGVASCRNAAWVEALEIFESIPEDPVAQVYAKKVRSVLQKPENRWDVVWNLTQK